MSTKYQMITCTNEAISNSIGAQLIRLVGWVKSMRPVLESLFHRVLLVPPIASRGEALKYAREVSRYNLFDGANILL